jgi:uncharacterized protein YdiU (UPF0061 family)
MVSVFVAAPQNVSAAQRSASRGGLGHAMAIAPARDKALAELTFDNSFARLGEPFCEPRIPEGIEGARLVATSSAAAALIELRLGDETRDALTALCAGRAIVRGMEPVAARYGGHQFGVWAGQLGDGRAILLGEVRTTHGQPWELQLKGAGRTSFSRGADGRAVIRSTVREFLASEAMDALGIPTTRALAMAAGDEPVLRESVERAATVIRLAPSFVRFGSFELFHYRGAFAEVKQLADYVIERFFPDAASHDGDERYARFLRDVVERTAALMAAWQCIGFAHGVMNTDNFSILGLTLDYGPYGFMEAYEPGFICNHTDEGGRYAFDHQPSIGLWNCYALAQALSSLVPEAQRTDALAAYEPAYWAAYVERMRAKLGLASTRTEDAALVGDLLELLAARRTDWTTFWRTLSDDHAATPALLGDDATSREWLARYAARIADDPRGAQARRAAMRAVNPAYVLRNWVAQEAIVAAEAGDDSVVAALLAVLRSPYDEHPEHAAWRQPAPARYADLSVSCSS